MRVYNEHDIEAILKPLQSAQPVDSGAIFRAKNVVMAQVRASHQLDSHQKVGPALAWTPFWAVGSFIRKGKFAPALAVALIILLGGGGVAAAAQGAVPGDALYAVKIATEKVAVKLAPTPRAKVRVETKLAERRAHELEILKERAVTAPPEVKVEIQKNIEILKERLEVIEQREQQEQIDAVDVKDLEFPPQAAIIPIPDDETRQFVENAEELFTGLRAQKAELKQKGLDIDGGIDSALQELQNLITQARALWNDKKFNNVRALEPQIQILLTRIAHLLNVEDSAAPEITPEISE